jgi:hypothetical protein
MGLMQLVSYGAQDIYISGNPQITFWKILYKRHTNFAMESIEVTFNGQADFGKRVTAVINRNADLMYKSYLAVVLPQVELTGTTSGATSGSTALTAFRWVNYIGHRLIKQVEDSYKSINNLFDKYYHEIIKLSILDFIDDTNNEDIDYNDNKVNINEIRNNSKHIKIKKNLEKSTMNLSKEYINENKEKFTEEQHSKVNIESKVIKIKINK